MDSRSAPRPALALTAVFLGTFMLIVDVQIVVVALPSISSALDTSLTTAQWTISAYSLSLAALLVPAGALADVLGRRRVFAAGLVAFTIGSMLCGLATSGLALVVFRAAQGIGGATVFATSLALIAQTFDGRARGIALGLWSAVVNIGLGAGPVLGGLLTEISWRWIFFANLPLGALAVVLTYVGVQADPARREGRVDVRGTLVLATGLTGLVLGLVEAGSRGWDSPLVLAPLAVSVLALTLFPVLEIHAPAPMVDLTLLRSRTLVGGLVAAVGMNGSLYAALLYLVLYLQDGLDGSPLETGLRLLVITVAATVTSVVTGRLMARVPARWLIGAGLVLVGAGLLLMRGGGDDWTHLVPGMVVAGAAAGVVTTPLASTAVGAVPVAAAGMASGLSATSRQIGLAVSVASLGGVFVVSGVGPVAVQYARALDRVLVVTAAIAMVAGVVAAALIRSREPGHASAATSDTALSS